MLRRVIHGWKNWNFLKDSLSVIRKSLSKVSAAQQGGFSGLPFTYDWKSEKQKREESWGVWMRCKQGEVKTRFFWEKNHWKDARELNDIKVQTMRKRCHSNWKAITNTGMCVPVCVRSLSWEKSSYLYSHWEDRLEKCAFISSFFLFVSFSLYLTIWTIR